LALRASARLPDLEGLAGLALRASPDLTSLALRASADLAGVNPGHVRNQGRPLGLPSASAHELFSGGGERTGGFEAALTAAGKKSRAEDQMNRAGGVRFRAERGSRSLESIRTTAVPGSASALVSEAK